MHEFVQPTLHEIRTEKVTKEIHTYDIFHRIQPIIETVILPTKHYIHSPDGKSLIEIPESQIPGRAGLAPSNNWKIVQTPLGQGQGHNSSNTSTRREDKSRNSYIPPKTVANQPDEYERSSAEPPVVGFSKSNGKSRFSDHPSFSDDPVLVDRQESVSPEGVPRTEYLWRHKPRYENVRRPQEQPHYVGAGIGDISNAGTAALTQNGTRDSTSSNYSDDRSYTHDSGRNAGVGEEPLFRDSGYGAGGGGLPGINAKGGLLGEFDRMNLASRPFDPRTGVAADGTPREVKAKKSSVDLRRVAGKQDGVRY